MSAAQWIFLLALAALIVVGHVAAYFDRRWLRRHHPHWTDSAVRKVARNPGHVPTAREMTGDDA